MSYLCYRNPVHENDYATTRENDLQGLSLYLQLSSNAEGDWSRQSSRCVVGDGLGARLRFVFTFAKREGMNGDGTAMRPS